LQKQVGEISKVVKAQAQKERLDDEKVENVVGDCINNEKTDKYCFEFVVFDKCFR
jgi:hypothetical protein